MDAPFRVSSQPMAARLAAGTIFINVLVLAFALYMLSLSHAHYENAAIVATRNVAQILSRDLAATFRRIDLAVIAAVEEIEDRYGGGMPKERWVNAYVARQLPRHPNLDALRIADADGLIRFGTNVSPQARLTIAERRFFRTLREQPMRALVVSEPILGQISGKWSIVLARRIDRRDGQFGGVVFAVVLLESFQRVFASLDLGPRGAISLRDLDLGTVVRYPEPGTMATAIGNRTFSREWPEKLKQDPVSGSYFAVGLDGRNRALSYRRLEGYPFYIIVGEFPDDYLAQWKQEAVSLLLLVAAFALVTSGLAMLAARAWKRHEAEARLREEDREKLMLELHDGFLQSAYGIGMALERSRTLIPASAGEASAVVAGAAADLNLVIQDLRAFMAGEQSRAYSEAAFRAEIDRMIPSGTLIVFTVEVEQGVATALKPDQASHVLRMVREAISNIVRHSEARAASLRIGQSVDGWRIVIDDDGKGFDASVPRNGLGLHHLHARANRLRGQADVRSAPGQGTCVTIIIPFSP